MVPRSDTLEAIVGVWGDSWFCEEFEVTDGPSLVTQAFVESCEGRLVDTVVEPGQFFLCVNSNLVSCAAPQVTTHVREPQI